MKQWKNNKKRILTVMLEIFLVSIIPLYLLGYNIYQLGVRKVIDSYTTSKLSGTTFLCKSLESAILNIRMQQYALINDKSVQTLSDLSLGSFNKSSEFRYINNIFADMIAKSSMSSMIDEITLYMPEYSEKISTVHGVDPITDDDLQNLTNYFIKSKNNIGFDDRGVVFLAYYPYYFNKQTEYPKTAVLTRLSYTSFNGFLMQFKNAKEKSELAVVDEASGKIVGATFSDDSFDDFIKTTGVYREKSGKGEGYYNEDYHGQKYTIIWADMTENGFTVYQIVPQSVIFSELYRYTTWIITFSVVTVILMVVCMISVFLLIYRPIRTLSGAFNQVEQGDLSIKLGNAWSREFQSLFSLFNSMVNKLDTHIKQEYQLQILARDAELKQLQYQINPHFMFNTYFLLNSLLQEENTAGAATLAKLMGTYLKYISQTSRHLAELNQEITHARAYAEIQQIRFARRIQMQFDDLPREYETILVPRLIIQPLIENAYEHGLRSLQDNGVIHIGFISFSEDSFEIFVEDNGDSVTGERLEEIRQILVNGEQGYSLESGIALINIQRRLAAVYSARSGLQASRSALGGLRITIHIEGAREHA